MLIAGILDFGKLEAGQVTLARKPLDVAEQLQRALGDVGYQLEGKQLRAEVEAAPDLPPVSADLEYVRRVVVNLVGNASKFAPAGSLIRLSARTSEGGDAVVVSVQDEGPGIAPE